MLQFISLLLKQLPAWFSHFSCHYSDKESCTVASAAVWAGFLLSCQRCTSFCVCSVQWVAERSWTLESAVYIHAMFFIWFVNAGRGLTLWKTHTHTHFFVWIIWHVNVAEITTQLLSLSWCLVDPLIKCFFLFLTGCTCNELEKCNMQKIHI